MVCDELVAAATCEVLQQLRPSPAPQPGRIPVGVSARHVHLSPQHVEQLFGPGAELHPARPLSQPGQYAAQEQVLLAGPKGSIARVRVLGPARKATQVEISATDALALGVKPPVRESGDHQGSVGLTLIGPAGAVTLSAGVIIARRHIHMRPEDARSYGVANGDSVWVASSDGDRRTAFGDVVVRVSDAYQLEFHIDTDEANAAGLSSGDTVVLIKP